MKIATFVIVIFMMNSCWGRSATLKTFSTDYCTGFAEGTKSRPDLWKHCCLEHDLYLWAGGTKDERDEADLHLKSCVAETGVRKIAEIMYLGIRAGRYSPVSIPGMHWGNAFYDEPTYKKLTESEIGYIESEIMNGYDFISVEIKNNFINSLYSRLDTP